MESMQNGLVMAGEPGIPRTWETLFAHALTAVGEIASHGRDDPFWTSWTNDMFSSKSNSMLSTRSERGALHFHVAVRGRQMYSLLRSIWQSVLGLGPDGQQMGQVNVREPNSFSFGVKGAHRLAAYNAKYCGNQMDCRELDQKRNFRSRGIIVPEVEYWRLPHYTNMLDAVHAAFRADEGHTMEGLIAWCNNALGVVYLATALGQPKLSSCPF